MNTATPPAPDVVDLADVAEDIFAYHLEALRRALVDPDDRPSRSALDYEPQPTEFVD